MSSAVWHFRGSGLTDQHPQLKITVGERKIDRAMRHIKESRNIPAHIQKIDFYEKKQHDRAETKEWSL
jgi:hypothetical protein